RRSATFEGAVDGAGRPGFVSAEREHRECAEAAEQSVEVLYPAGLFESLRELHDRHRRDRERTRARHVIPRPSDNAGVSSPKQLGEYVRIDERLSHLPLEAGRALGPAWRLRRSCRSN